MLAFNFTFTIENEYEDDDFEDERALGIQNLDDEEEEDYDDEKFEQVFEEAEDLRRFHTSSSKRPISRKYIKTPASDNIVNSNVDPKFISTNSNAQFDKISELKYNENIDDTDDQINDYDDKIIEVTEKEETKESILKTISKVENNETNKSIAKYIKTNYSKQDSTKEKSNVIIEKKKSVTKIHQNKNNNSKEHNIKMKKSGRKDEKKTLLDEKKSVKQEQPKANK